MADSANSEAFKRTVREKWDYALKRMNGDQPDVDGLVAFTEARLHSLTDLSGQADCLTLGMGSCSKVSVATGYPCQERSRLW